MATFHSIVARLLAPFSGESWSDGVNAEFETHLQLQIDENLRAGMNEREARRAALDKLGAPALGVEVYRERMAFPWLDALVRDARYGLRSLGHSPGFVAVAILSLALGIGANTAIFSVLNGVLLRALPYPEPGQLFMVREAFEEHSKTDVATCVTGGNFLLWRQRARMFQTLAALIPVTHNLGLGNETVQVHGARVSYDMLPMLGVQPLLGRNFAVSEDQAGSDNVVLLTYALWRDRFGSDGSIVGRTVRFDGRPYSVAGVLPPKFYFPKPDQLYGGKIAGWTSPVEYFMPLALRPNSNESRPSVGNDMNFAVVGRIKPGVSAAQGQSEIDRFEQEIQRIYGSHGWQVRMHGVLEPLKNSVTGAVDRALWLLMGWAAVVLLIVCVNLAGLMLGRAMGRTHETAVRVALGASRAGLVRQFLVEGLLLSLAGGLLGVVLAYAGVHMLLLKAPVELPRADSIRVDTTVLLFSLLLCLGAGVLSAVAPALRLSHVTPLEALNAGATRTSAARASTRLRDILVCGEVALCTVLLTAALLLSTSLNRILRANEWLRADHVLTAELSFPMTAFRQSPARQQLADRIVERIRPIAGVESVAITNAVPLTGGRWTNDVRVAELPRSGSQEPNANFRFVSPDYFYAMGMKFVAGRPFADTDNGQARVVISANLARTAFDGRNPLGLHLRWFSMTSNDNKEVDYEVTGVVADARTNADEEPPLIVYFPYWSWTDADSTLVVRTTADPQALTTALRRALRDAASEVAIARLETMSDIVDQAVSTRRFVVWLGTLFAVFATFLAALGLYGVMALSVAQRTQEIGIRMALGARGVTIVRMVLMRGVGLSLAGLFVGVAGAFAATRVIANLLYGVKPNDPTTYAAVGALLVSVTLLACCLPALRATRVHPMAALRCE